MNPIVVPGGGVILGQRRAIVKIAPQFLHTLCTVQLEDLGNGMKKGSAPFCVQGLPPDAKLVGGGIDNNTKEFVLVFEHPDFPYANADGSMAQIAVMFNAVDVNIQEAPPPIENNAELGIINFQGSRKK